MIQIHNLNFKYAGSSRQNLINLSAEFKTGTLNVLIGKNGSGKTTLLDLISNVITRPQGIQGLPKDEDIIYQLQGLLFPNILKGKDLFRFFLYSDYRNTIKLSSEPYTDHFMSKSEIELMHRVWDTAFGQLSVGERRYLCILAITLMKRKLYLFDEPTSGIDPEARGHILKRIEHLIASPNTIVLLTSHTLQEFKHLNCRIFFLHNGEIKFEGTYEQFVGMAENKDPDSAFNQFVK